MKKGKRQINIKINFTNRWLYTLIAVGVLVIMGVGVYAASSLLTPGVAPNPGHPISQTSPPSSCSAGQVLQWNGTSNADGGWACGTIYHGIVPFISSGTWNVPSGVRYITVTCIGGGGGGGGASRSNYYAGGGGGGAMCSSYIDLNGVAQLTVTVGGGGAPGSGSYHSSATDGQPGGTSSITVNGMGCIVSGGSGGQHGDDDTQTSGGHSAGGAGGVITSYSGIGQYPGGAGGVGTLGSGAGTGGVSGGSGGAGAPHLSNGGNYGSGGGGGGGDYGHTGGWGAQGMCMIFY
jgi:hypothetical protein